MQRDFTHQALEVFISRWEANEGGQERSNAALFLTELCDAIEVERPHPAHSAQARNDYVFERQIAVDFMDGRRSARIDLYKRDCFVLEAKQSGQTMRQKIGAGVRHHIADYFAGPASGKMRGWDLMMLNARYQAETYARALARLHDMPPFVMTCDIGLCIEVFARDPQASASYMRFPDKQGSRILLDDLRKPHLRERLRRIWTDPRSLLG